MKQQTYPFSTVCLLLAAAFLFSCSQGGKKQRLALENAEEEQATSYQSMPTGTVVLDTIVPPPGVKYQERRSPDSRLAVKLDFARTDIPEKELDLAAYYASVQYVTLKFPFPEKGGFLGESNIHIMTNPGLTSMRGFGASVYLPGDKIIAGDRYQGFYLYNKDGEYIRPLVQPDNWHDFDVRNNLLTIEQSRLTKHLGVSVLGENYLLHTREDKKGTLYFGNAVRDEIYLQRPYYYGVGELASPSSYFLYYYHPERGHPVLARTFSLEDEVLCDFANHHPPLVKQENVGYYPQRRMIYEYDGKLTFKQQYNDTLFRLKSDRELEAAYILHFGAKRQTLESGYIGGHDGKYALDTWVETKDFVWLVITEGRDTPAARERNTVTFRYFFYDKQEKQLYRLPTADFPEKVVMRNSLAEGLPMRGYFAQSNGRELYEAFTKMQLQLLMKHPVFKQFSPEEQERMLAQHEALGDRDLLLIILK